MIHRGQVSKRQSLTRKLLNRKIIPPPKERLRTKKKKKAIKLCICRFSNCYPIAHWKKTDKGNLKQLVSSGKFFTSGNTVAAKINVGDVLTLDETTGDVAGYEDKRTNDEDGNREWERDRKRSISLTRPIKSPFRQIFRNKP